MCGGQYRAAAETVTDQYCRRAMSFAQMVSGSDQVFYVGREMRIGEFATAATESGEVETQHANSVCRQPLGDALCC